MTENEDVKTTSGEQKPRNPFGVTSDLESTIDELQRQLAAAEAERDKYRKAMCDLRLEIRDVINHITEIAPKLGRIHDILKSVDK